MYKIMGWDPVKFTDDQTGEMVDGVRFHLLADEVSSSIKHGCEVLNVFFAKERILGTPDVGATCDLKFSVRNGKPRVTGIEIK